MDKHMQMCIREARIGMRKNEGGPFGAMVLKGNKILARAHNEVLKTNDPSAHAEVLAIRRACAKLRTFDLSGCTLVCTCEPCPMCLGAIHWAKLTDIKYGCTRKDAAALGFADEFIYDVMEGKSDKKQVSAVQQGRKDCLHLFSEWDKKEDKKMY